MYNFKEGQRLVVELKNECYVGDFLSTNTNCTRIELTNVQDFSTGQQFSGVQLYYRNEIKSLTPLKSDSSDAPETPISVTCLISASELDIILASIRSAQYFFHTDRPYYAAIEDIKVQPHIGLAIELVTQSSVSLITVCVPSTQKIYIFDVISLGCIPGGLKDILQAKLPLKILHNSRAAAVALKRTNNVQLTSFFDTLVAHLWSDHSRNAPTSLKECLQIYLNYPPSLWIQNTNVNWLKRPFDNERKVFAAQNAAYLSRLYSFLLHERLLSSFYTECNYYGAVYVDDKEDLEEVFFETCSKPNAALRELAQTELNFDGVAADLLKIMN